MRRDVADGACEIGVIHNVLHHGNAQCGIEFSLALETCRIRSMQLGAQSLALQPVTGFCNHRRADVYATDAITVLCKTFGPATDTAANLEYVLVVNVLQPWTQCTLLTPLDGAIVELRHAVGTHGAQAAFVSRKFCGALFPVRGKSFHGFKHDAPFLQVASAAGCSRNRDLAAMRWRAGFFVGCRVRCGSIIAVISRCSGTANPWASSSGRAASIQISERVRDGM